MNIVLITNGNSDIGFGHVTRTLCLYSFLKKQNHHVKLIVPATCTFPLNKDFYNVDSFSEDDLGDIEEKYDIVIIDSVEVDFNQLSWLDGKRIFVVSITLFLFDLRKRYEHLSFFPSIEETKKRELGKTLIFSGRDYITFREEFSDVDFSVNRQAKKILITMGGTDPQSLSLLALKALIKDSTLEVTVLMSENAKDFPVIQDYASRFPHVSLLGFCDNMAEMMTQFDLALINGGLTRYETCVVGIPFIAISIHQKQFEITQELVDQGVGINLGVYAAVDTTDIYDATKSLLVDYEGRRAMSEKMTRLLDTRGVDRICKIIFKNYEAYKKMG